MSKAEQVIKLMDEVSGSPVKNAEQLAGGKTVMFKPGHKLAGLLGRCIRAKDGKADIKVGGILQVDVPFGDLLAAPEVDLGKPGPG